MTTLVSVFITLLLTAPGLSYAANVRLVHDIYPGRENGIDMHYPPVVAGNQLCFIGYDNIHGGELWCYDGSDRPPALVKDINLDYSGLLPQRFAVLNDVLYFSAQATGYGMKLWSYDGLTPPQLVANMRPDIFRTNPTHLTVIGDKLYFVALRSLWYYDGVNPPSIAVEDFNFNHSFIGNFITHNNRLYFQAAGELWYYDGLNLPIQITTSKAHPFDLTVFGDALYLRMNSGSNLSGQLISIDSQHNININTQLNTHPDWLKNSNTPDYLGTFEDRLYFTEPDPFRLMPYDVSPPDTKLWAYDGIDTLKVIFNFNPLGRDHLNGLTEWRGQMYFQADDGVNGRELWRYDGIGVPHLVADIDPDGSSMPKHLVVFQDKLYFIANDGVHGSELYVLTEPTPVLKRCPVYGVHTHGSQGSQVFSIGANSQLTLLGAMHEGLDLKSLDLHPNDQHLFASSGGDGGSLLYAVDIKEGHLTELGRTGFTEVNALSFNPINATLWGWASGAGLIRLDPISAQGQLITRYAGNVKAMTWDNKGQFLYIAETSHANPPDILPDDAEYDMHLWRYDPASSTVTAVCTPDSLPAKLETLEMISDKYLLFSYSGRSTLRTGLIVLSSTATCESFEFEPISTPFNAVVGLAYPQACVQ